MPHQETVIVNGRELPSVTQILRVIDKPYVDKWAIKHSLVKARLLVPSESRASMLSKISDDILEAEGLDRETFWMDGEEIGQKAAKRGRELHNVVESFLLGKPPEPGQENLVKLVDQFLRRMKWGVMEIEKLVIHEPLGYRGTLDAILAVPHPMVTDWKFTGRVQKETVLQLSAYGQAYAPNSSSLPGAIIRIAERKGKPRKRNVLDFPELGFIIEPVLIPNLVPYYPVFNACLEVYKFMTKEGINE